MRPPLNPALLLPSREAILDRQAAARSWYLSGAFDLVTAKHGLLGFAPEYGEPRLPAYGFAGHGLSWGDDLENRPLVLEGPLHETVLSGLNLVAQETSAAELTVEGVGGHPIQCGYSSCIVRKIPKESGEVSDPFSFECSDERWHRGDFPIQFFRPDGNWKPLLTAVSDRGEQGVVAVTDGVHLALGFSLFDMAVFQHCLPPLGDAGYYSMECSRPTWDMEQWLFDNAIRLFTANGCTVFRAGDWPVGYRAGFSVRHDVDRKTAPEDLAELLDFYDSINLRASFFFLKRTAMPRLIGLLRKRGHEIVQHSEAARMDELKQEKRLLEQAAGQAMAGFTTHGGCGGVGYLGATHYQWGQEAGFLYGELIGKDNRLPFPAFTISRGLPQSVSLMIPSVHNSMDKGMTPEAHNLEVLQRHVPPRIASGAHCVLMNHPDIHLPQLKELIGGLELAETWTAPLGAVCRWSRAVKSASRVCVNRDRAVLSLPEPPGMATTFEVMIGDATLTATIPPDGAGLEVDLEKETCRVISGSERLQRYFPTVKKLIVNDFLGKGMTEEQAVNTLRTNTELLEGRVRKLSAALNILPHHHVAELGCGFGFLALGMQALTGAKVTGFDINPAFLDLGAGLLDAHPELARSLEFKELDYVREAPGSGEFDAALLNNTFCYILGRERQASALENIHASLAPGGRVCLYHFNPWYYREPFTRLPFVHWLPTGIGNAIARMMGRRQITDLDYISPARLSAMLRSAGFSDVRFLPGGWKPFSLRRPMDALRPYYATTAVKC